MDSGQQLVLMQPQPAHQTHTQSELDRERERERHLLGSQQLSLTSGLLTAQLPVGPAAPGRSDVLHLPRSVNQRSRLCSLAFGVSPSLKLAGETQDPRYLFYVFQTRKPPTQQRQHTTARSIHICSSDLGHYHFIV